jgi:hypothetical protein
MAAFVVVVLPSTTAGSSTPSPYLGDRRFVVVDRKEEKVK